MYNNYDISGSSINNVLIDQHIHVIKDVEYTINDPNTGQQITDEYTHRISDKRCDASIQNHKYCKMC